MMNNLILTNGTGLSTGGNLPVFTAPAGYLLAAPRLRSAHPSHLTSVSSSR
ncbi:MAG: hypothetical protein ACTII7_12555 [Galactobacter sp.]